MRVFESVDVANITARYPGRGAFTKFLAEVEALAASLGRAVYVENVLSERFQNFFVRCGYAEVSPAGAAALSYVKFPEDA